MTIHSFFSTPIYQIDLQPDTSIHSGMLKYMKRFDSNISKRQRRSDVGMFGDSLPGLTTDRLHCFPEFQWLTEALSGHLTEYLKTLSSIDSHYSVFVQKSWPVVCQPAGGQVLPHTHRNAHLSAVYYVQSEPGNKTGRIKFMAPFDHYSMTLPIDFDDSDSSIVFEPLQGRLLLFPSSLMHRVDQYFGTLPRYSVSYDILLSSDSGMSTEMVMSHPSSWYQM